MKERPRSIVVLFAWTLVSWLATGAVGIIAFVVSAGSAFGFMTGATPGIRDTSIYLVIVLVLSVVTFVLTLATLYRAAAALDWLVAAQAIRTTPTGSMRTVRTLDRA